MKITKYEHACFSVEIDDNLLIIDPGNFTTNLAASDTVTAIVITHEHPDHFDRTALDMIVSRNPHAVVVAPKSVTSQLEAAGFTCLTVAPGDTINQPPFSMTFFGGLHAVIHTDIPQIDNVGVMINDTIFYPGDSLVLPTVPVRVLALPVSAPWLKISEVFDYVQQVAPTMAFPTHDAILSHNGKLLVDRLVSSFAKRVGAQYTRIDDAPLEL